MAKIKIREGDKKMAKKSLEKKKMWVKNLESLRNDLSILVDYFYAFKNAENNENIEEILNLSDSLYKKAFLKREEIDN